MGLLRTVFTVLHLGVVLLLFATMLNAYIPPKIIPYFNLLSLAFPVLMLIHILFSIVWVVSWRKRAFVFLASFLFLLSPVGRWINFSSEPKETPNLKVVTFNIKSGKISGENIPDYLEKQNADVVFLQECGTFHNNIKGFPQSNSIDYGVATLTKHKILDKKTIIHNWEDIAFATSTDIEINGKPIRFINMYLQPFRFEKQMFKMKDSEEENKEQAATIGKTLLKVFKQHQIQVDIIKKEIDASPYPVIVGGDWNSVPNSYEYYHLSEGLQDAFVKAGNGSSTSFHDYKFPLRLDYLMTSKSIKPVHYKVDRSVHLSDHFPVVAEFKIP